MKNYDVAIIGGGIIGAAIAYELSKYNVTTILFEKNPAFALETSRGNSGVIHGGFDPEPHKVEARLNLLGNQTWVQEIFPFIQFPRKKIDSLVIAFNQEELKHLDLLYERGLQNQLDPKDLKILNQQELFAKEPYLNPQAQAALLCTSSWLIDPVKATYALIGVAEKNGVETQTNAEVVSIINEHKKFHIQTTNDKNTIQTKFIVNCAGHYADVIAQKAGYGDFQQKTRRGEYCILDASEKAKVNSICFMVPTIHGKGVIVAPTLNGQVLVGPTAEENVPKADTALVTPEKRAFIAQIGQKIIPSLNTQRVVQTLAGSRPIDVLTDDFVIQKAKLNPNFIHVGGMQSPGLSSAPAIAQEVIQLLVSSGLILESKENFDPHYTIQ